MRSYRELWLWFGAAMLTLAAAFVAIALAYFTKEQNYSLYTSWPLLTSIGVFVLAFACFGLAILGWAFPPWAKPKFPNIYVEIYGSRDIPTTRPYSNGMQAPARLRGFMARITNMDREQNASLTIDLLLKLEPGSAGRIGETYGIPVNWHLDPTLNLELIRMPIVLAPGTTVAGDLVYEISGLLPEAVLAKPERIRLQLLDHVTGQRMSIATETGLGNFSRNEMSPSRGGIEFLGPEYEVKPARFW